MVRHCGNKWSFPRIINAVRVLPKWVSSRLRLATATASFFLQFALGNFEGISQAPTMSKWGAAFLASRKMVEPKLHELPTASHIYKQANRAKQITGSWPISFSFPKPALPAPQQVAGYLCPTFPGHKYSFESDKSYYENYRKFSYALTHKKGGWDCFRHLEVMHVGAVPFMPDADIIPSHTMVHYPKAFLAEVAASMRRSRLYISPSVRENLADYFDQNLTSAAMAKYLLRAAGIQNSARVLFIDAATPTRPDYLSILTLIGLKQVLGKQVDVAFPVNYIYEDWTGDARELYGRGFGFSRTLKSGIKNQNEFDGRELSLHQSSLTRFDAIVIGSEPRNTVLAHDLLSAFPPKQTVWLHGEDRGPSIDQLDSYQKTGVAMFVRELNVRKNIPSDQCVPPDSSALSLDQEGSRTRALGPD